MRWNDKADRSRLSVVCLLAGLTCGWCCLMPGQLRGQEGEGTGEAPAVAAEETKPEPTMSESEKAKGGEPETRAEIPAPKNSPLVSEPKTADEMMDAISLTLEIARLDATKIYLQQLLATKPSDEELSRLRRKYGAALYLRLANSKELQPESLELLERSNKAFANQVADPEQVKLRIAELQKNADQRDAAYAELRGAGIVVMPGIIEAYYRSEDPDLRDILSRLMVTIGRPGVGPLLGALETDSTPLLLAAIRALELIGDRRAADHLWYLSAAPTQPEVIHAAAQSALRRLVPSQVGTARGSTSPAEKLRQLTRKYYRGEASDRDPLEEAATVWAWDSAAQTVVPNRVSFPEESMLLALKFGKQALELAPQDQELQVIYLTGMLDHEVQIADGIYTVPEGKGTAFEASLKAGAEKVSRVLEIALDDRRISAAVSACRILGRIGGPRQLQQHSGRTPPLVQALNDHDPRVQYEAAQAIVQMKPMEKFPLSGRVVEVLGRALVGESHGSWNCLIADPSADRGTGLMGMVRALGAEATLATTGRSAFDQASSGAAPDFILMNIGISQWGLTETLANLRGDVRTMRIPVVMFGPARSEDVVENHLSDTILDRTLEMSVRVKALEDLNERVRNSGGEMDKSRLRKLSDLWDEMISKRQLMEGRSPDSLAEEQARKLEAEAGKRQIISKALLIDEKRRLRKQFEADRVLDKKMEEGLKELTGNLVVKSIRIPGQMVRPETAQGSEDPRRKYHRELEENSTLFYIEEPQSPEDLRTQVRLYEHKLRSSGLGVAERQREARLAAVSLAEIGLSKLSSVCPTAPAESALLQASHNPEVLYDVLRAMSVLPTGSVQNRLAEIVNNEGIELPLRIQATEALTMQVNQVGSSLKLEEVQRLERLADETTDEKLQTALLALIGSLKP